MSASSKYNSFYFKRASKLNYVVFHKNSMTTDNLNHCINLDKIIRNKCTYLYIVVHKGYFLLKNPILNT